MTSPDTMTFKLAWKRTVRTLLDKVDLLLSPTAPVGAPLIEDGKSLYDSTRDLVRNTYCGALGNIPRLSVPGDVTRAGIPIGCAFQKHIDFHLRVPLS